MSNENAATKPASLKILSFPRASVKNRWSESVSKK